MSSNYFWHLLFRKSFQKFPQSDSEGWKSWRDLKSQLAHLKSEVSFLSKLTGINIRNYSKTEDITNNEVTEKGKYCFWPGYEFKFYYECVLGQGRHVTVCLWRAEDNFKGSVLSPPCWGKACLPSSFCITHSRLTGRMTLSPSPSSW